MLVSPQCFRWLSISLILCVVGRLAAADGEAPPGPQAPQPPPVPPPPELLGWSHQFHPGLFFTSVIASDEGWSEFEDFGHVTNTITAGVKMRFATYLALELGLRMYYESRPNDVAQDEPGYSRWFMRQDTLIGIDAVF